MTMHEDCKHQARFKNRAKRRSENTKSETGHLGNLNGEIICHYVCDRGNHRGGVRKETLCRLGLQVEITECVDKETESEPIIWDIRDEEEEYPFVNKYPSFQEEPIVLVEEKSCPIYDIDNEEEESMPVYDTDIEDVIEEEEGFVRKRGFGREEDNIEDIVVVANDIYSSMIQTTLSVDVVEGVNTKSHELMSFRKSIIIKGIQVWMLRVQGTSEANSRTSFSQAREDDAEALTFSQSQNA
ncbi:hypothetical protein Tco_0571399 [Tanacetum coccineum]